MPTILIVDDEERIRELIREHLEFAGFTCREAGDGSAALASLSSEGADLVILDACAKCAAAIFRPRSSC